MKHFYIVRHNGVWYCARRAYQTRRMALRAAWDERARMAAAL